MKWRSRRWISMVSLLFILIHSWRDQCGSGRLLLRPPSCVCVFNVCVLVCSALLCSGLFHMCLTLLWQGCPASLGRWRMSETRAEKRTASQHLMEWETHRLDGWPADATAWEQSRGWRPSKTPNACVKYHSFSRFPVCFPTCAHIHSDTQE